MVEKGRPWMRWHVTRWRNSPRVLQMPLAAQGAYRNLLDAAWQQGGRLPNLPAVLWKYALAQSPEEFAAVAAPVLAMFTVSECGNWLSNETLMEECADRMTFADELSRKRSEAGKKGSAARWSADGKPDGKSCSKTVANQDLPSPNPPASSQLITNAWHKREEKRREEKIR
jgi:uncharacterized protein YdaU (DUF1376 family)